MQQAVISTVFLVNIQVVKYTEGATVVSTPCISAVGWYKQFFPVEGAYIHPE